MSVLDEPDFQLRWPTAIFQHEGGILLRRAESTNYPSSTDDIGWLLEEAFAGSAVADRFRLGSVSGNPWETDVETATGIPFFSALVHRAEELRAVTQRTPYFRERVRGSTGRAALPMDRTKTQFARLIEDFREQGYLDKAMPEPCVDDWNRGVDKAEVIAVHLDEPDLWPLRPDAWDDDLFYDLVEVFHDLVARPRHRSWHSWNECGWHYSDYSIATGQKLYRWRINQLLDRSEVPYRLADSGEDEGRLVAVADEARESLLTAMVSREEPTSGGKVQHAIALFRARGSSIEQRRSAVRVLADVLEAKRQLLKEELFSKDEGALFEIANRFAIRHNDASQQGDYNPAFFDWIFWWYLATIELTDRLIEQQGVT